jgi:phosphoribosylaminoimidazole-succinocarboxamide synthase
MESNNLMNVITRTDFPDLKLFRRGKVRDVYDLGDNYLIVATDRISAFDVIMPNPIPHKGILLNKISEFWFNYTSSVIRNHLIHTDIAHFPASCGRYASILQDRSMLVQKTNPLPVECIVRGYISGSGWKEYNKTGTICGMKLPDGLKESDRLSEPIFTPSTKAETGHDRNISFTEIQSLIGVEISQQIRDYSIQIYLKAAQYALSKGIIIADTKMEFGLIDDQMILIDELFTPDSSRFWPLDLYHPGSGQPSFDKQFLRDYLLLIKWDNNTPPPQLPETIIDQTRMKYQLAHDLLIC